MDANEAIGILRGDVSPSSVLHREIAENMGADALEFQGWLFGEGDNQWIRVEWVMRKWNGEDSFLDFALGEWQKEKAMDSKRAAEVLRDPGNHGPEEKFAARDVAIQALEAWAWVGKEEHNVMCNIKHKRWEIDSGVRIIGFGPTPLAAVLDAMEQEGKG